MLILIDPTDVRHKEVPISLLRCWKSSIAYFIMLSISPYFLDATISLN